MDKYIIPKRILCEEKTEGSENIFIDRPLQASFSDDKCVLIKENGYILLDYNVKVYRICGFIDFLTQSCNIEKNKALVTEINSKIKKLKKWK